MGVDGLPAAAVPYASLTCNVASFGHMAFIGLANIRKGDFLVEKLFTDNAYYMFETIMLIMAVVVPNEAVCSGAIFPGLE